MMEDQIVPPEQYMDARALASLLDVHPTTIHNWRRDGRFPAHRFSARCVRYRLSEVLAGLRPVVVDNPPPRARIPRPAQADFTAPKMARELK